VDALTRGAVAEMLVGMSSPNRAPGPTATIAAAIVAIILGTGIIVLALINPYALIGLAPVLLAVAGIVRAVTGTRPDAPDHR
jgi:hypothetical protein